MKVWLVYNGDEVMGLFSNEKAAKHCAEVNDWNDIEVQHVQDTYEYKAPDYDAPNLGED
jgi:hypothetical protein